MLAAGTKGRRLALPNSRILIHQPMIMGGISGQATDIDIQAREILGMRRKLNEILVQATNQSKEKIEKDTDRDYFMSAEEAQAYGIVDQVIAPRDKTVE